MKVLSRTLAVLVLAGAQSLLAQSSGSITQTVNKRNTLGSLSAVQSLPSDNVPLTPNMPVGTELVFTYQLFAGGAPAPTTEPLTVYDTQNGTPVQLIPVNPQLTTVPGSNLLPYSQVDLSNGWAIAGTSSNVNVVVGNAGGPDGSTPTEFSNMAPSALASTITFQDNVSGVQYVVSGVSAPSYAGQTMTYSVWGYSSAGTTITLSLADGSGAAEGSASCALPAGTWARCSVTATFASSAATGFTAAIKGTAGSSVVLWGNQVEQASVPGPYVATVGIARLNVATEQYSFAYDDFDAGAHSVTVRYGGDANLVASTSNAVAFTFGKGTATASVADAPAGTSVYGQAVTLTASVTAPQIAPTGTVTFLDGTTTLGTAALGTSCTSSVNGTATQYTCTATLTLDGTGGTKLLAQGSHSITVAYQGDSNFESVTSSAITHTVTAAAASSALNTSVTSSLNPSTYGDAVVITAKVTVNSSFTTSPLPLSGTITITDGSTTLGTINCASQSSSTCVGSVTIPGTNGTYTDTLFNAGSHTITATYSGDPNYQ